ncbi:hypothetical protein A2165_03075 [Candidatus Curtissbacteria bacterium RBG_13_40_7]|uniref:5'-3' exonuclease domain-containing protein n=1 Tax=Candidatus Curtissbacteria bacterium RBG_13_40_7 TaxID=1797706 RepID=A0A1F5FW92_9BACT|nr:MAG: hypothetical protein A2165_03075 [Candidatus Curtissbacteria bacterium RBG_13_40_7]
MKRLLLIDGNSLFHRAYHALPPITDKKGELANAVFGFSNMLIKAINEVKPTHVACAFDTRAPTFRHIEFEKYKATRVTPPPDLYPQLPKVKDVLDAFGIAYFEKEGYEADDILATITSRVVHSQQLTVHRKKKTVNREPKTVNEVVILSGDRDVLQLVDGGVKVQMPGWNLKETTLYGAKEVKDKYGLEPHQMVDYKSLTGDPSDNVSGISGIGPKTASQLLQEFHTLENLFKNVGKIPEPLRSKLVAGRAIALAAKRLVELDRDVDIELELGKLEFKPNWEQVRREYEELGFKSIVAKLPGGDKKEVSKVSKVTKVTKDENQLKLV